MLTSPACCYAYAVSPKFAIEWCKGPEPKKLKCGWASQDELSNTATGCYTCGTRVGGTLQMSKLPWFKEYCPGCGGSQTQVLQMVSLACRPGKLLVRVVWKIIQKSTDVRGTGVIIDVEKNALGDNQGAMRRCQLELRSFSTQNPTYAGKTSKDEVAAALASKEVNCKTIGQGSNPPNTWYTEGGWYSDTLTFDYAGCAGLTQNDRRTGKPPATYIPTMPYIYIGGSTSYLVAKFEVQEAS